MFCRDIPDIIHRAIKGGWTGDGGEWIFIDFESHQAFFQHGQGRIPQQAKHIDCLQFWKVGEVPRK